MKMILNNNIGITPSRLIKGRAGDKVITKKKIMNEEQTVTKPPLRIFPIEIFTTFYTNVQLDRYFCIFNEKSKDFTE